MQLPRPGGFWTTGPGWRARRHGRHRVPDERHHRHERGDVATRTVTAMPRSACSSPRSQGLRVKWSYDEIT
jgi:hypothetical protein